MATTTAKRATVQGSEATSDNGRKQRPVWVKRGFPVQVAVFEFGRDNDVPIFSVKLTRTFRRDDNSEWENSEYFGGGDLLRAAKLLEAADSFVQSRLEQIYQSRKAEAQSY